MLFGHNTSILSRDDNMSSGNLATINRSIILEEHGSTSTFGAQLGVPAQKMLAVSAWHSLAGSHLSRHAAAGAGRVGNRLEGFYSAALSTKLVLQWLVLSPSCVHNQRRNR